MLAGRVKHLVFDLADSNSSAVPDCACSRWRANRCKERGGQASFVNMQPQIQEVFEIMKSLPGMAIFKDMEELDRYLAARQKAHEENQ